MDFENPIEIPTLKKYPNFTFYTILRKMDGHKIVIFTPGFENRVTKILWSEFEFFFILYYFGQVQFLVVLPKFGYFYIFKLVMPKHFLFNVFHLLIRKFINFAHSCFISGRIMLI